MTEILWRPFCWEEKTVSFVVSLVKQHRQWMHFFPSGKNTNWYPSLSLRSLLFWKDDSEICRTIEHSMKKKERIIYNIRHNKTGEYSRRKRRMKSNGSKCEIRSEFGRLYVLQRSTVFCVCVFHLVISCKQLVLLLFAPEFHCLLQRNTHRENVKKGYNSIKKRIKRNSCFFWNDSIPIHRCSMSWTTKNIRLAC